MTPDQAVYLYGSCIGAGVVLGGVIALLNSWLP